MFNLLNIYVQYIEKLHVTRSAGKDLTVRYETFKRFEQATDQLTLIRRIAQINSHRLANKLQQVSLLDPAGGKRSPLNTYLANIICPLKIVLHH